MNNYKHDIGMKKMIERPFSLIIRLAETLGKRKKNRQAKMSRSELLNLGEYLLRDLGFDQQGRPLNSEWPKNQRQ